MGRENSINWKSRNQITVQNNWNRIIDLSKVPSSILLARTDTLISSQPIIPALTKKNLQKNIP